jgi:excinuclease ABC subunit A
MCQGTRLSKEVLAIRIGGLNIHELGEMPIRDAAVFLDQLVLSENDMLIGKMVFDEVKARYHFLINVGLDYLNLTRSATTLSGGEAQRIRLATQIGSKLTGVLYVLDEPSIGLHQRDNDRLINTLKGMRDLGNSMIVVEHDEDTMLEADYIIDIGPGSGSYGGNIVAHGTPSQIMKNKKSLTGAYLSGREKIEVPSTRRTQDQGFISIINASENNLKNVTVDIPKNNMVCVT